MNKEFIIILLRDKDSVCTLHFVIKDIDNKVNNEMRRILLEAQRIRPMIVTYVVYASFIHDTQVKYITQ